MNDIIVLNFSTASKILLSFLIMFLVLIIYLAKKFQAIALSLNNFDKGIESVEELPEIMKPLMPGIVSCYYFS